MSFVEIAPNVSWLSLGFVNVYAIENESGGWVLVDSGLDLNKAKIEAAAEEKFDSPPEAIVLTHAHLDHAGSARQLAELWKAPIYVHRLEWPYVVGKAVHPPLDPTTGGALAFMTRLMPWPLFNFTGLVQLLPEDGKVPGLAGWEWLETPGHTAGHVAFWNAETKVVLTGDALCTADFDKWDAILFKTPKLARPATPATSDWGAAQNSVEKLAALEPKVIGAGHGYPLSTGDVAGQLHDLARDFAPPEQGRYVPNPAVCDENGIVSLPPAPPDPFARNLAIGGSAAGAMLLARKLWKRARR